MHSGIDTDDLDPRIPAREDLFEHVNGRWIANTAIPKDRARYGSFDILVEQSEAAMRTLIEKAAKQVRETVETAATDEEWERDNPTWRVGALYTSFMGTDRINRLGWSVLADDFAQIAAVDSPGALMRLSGAQQRAGSGGLIGLYVAADAGSPDVEIAYLVQSGIGLPDEEYYHSDQHEKVREQYRQYLQTMLGLAAKEMAAAGLDLGPADEVAERVFDLETRIAQAHWNKVDTRDAVRAYNRLSAAELTDLAPGVDWTAWAEGLIGESTSAEPVTAEHLLEHVVVRQPDVMTAMGTLLTEVDLATWRAWAAVRLINGNATFLSDEVVEEYFDFYGRTLSGVPELRARWKRGVGLIESLIGEDAGQMYVAEHYPEQAAQRMQVLVANVIEAFRRRIGELEWMGEQTRAAALTKLSTFRPKIGHPKTWRDYSAIDMDPVNLLKNVRRANAIETDRELAKIGGPVDPDEWLMTPQTVNAYYHPLHNEIVFPAAILQPPFFDAEADDATNYGGIGAVIAHEIGHGFDDQGSRYDHTGTLRDWWTDQDREAFDALAGKLIAQFDGLSPRTLPEAKVKGALTVGENIGDLCGVEMALSAYRIAHPEGGEVLDDLTGEQRFFLSWSQIWRNSIRPKEAERLLAVDVHSPADLRANTVRNVDAFHEAFGTQPDDGMWLDPADRVRIF